MRGTSIGDYSSGDDSSDIRTVRTNTTNIFSQSSYYTNPTLPGPASQPPHTILNHPDDDQTTLTDDVSSVDYTSPTSIMTNYESYSKFGAAPIYQNIPTNVPPRRVPTSSQSQPHPQATNGKGEVFSLNTIVEENTTSATTSNSPTKVYHPPSYYKNQRRITTTTNTTTTTSQTNHITVISSKNSLDDRSTDHFTTTGSSSTTSNSNGTSSSSTNSSNNSKSSLQHQHPIVPPNHRPESKKENMTLSVNNSKDNDGPSMSTKSSSASSSSSSTTTTAFSIFKRMTTGSSPLRNRSQSASPVPTVSSSTNITNMKASTVVPISTMSTSSSHSGNSHSESTGNSTGSQQQPQPTRSLRNYMHTLAYKSRRGSSSSPNTIPSGRGTPPPSLLLQSKKIETEPMPTSPTTSIHSTTSHHSNGDNTEGSKNTIASPPPPTPQELIATPIKSNSSSNSNNIPIKEDNAMLLDADTYREHSVQRTLKDPEETLPKTSTCPTTTSTMTTTGSNGSTDTSSNSSYYNPILKSVSSKLFLPSEDAMISPIQAHQVATIVSPIPVVEINHHKHTNANMDDVYPKARLNLDIIDQMAAISTGDIDLAQLPSDLPPPPKESFRLWTDEDSAFGTSWYSFSTSPFVGEHDDTIDTSMESDPSAIGATAAGAAVVSPNAVATAYPLPNVLSTSNAMNLNGPTKKAMIVPPVTNIPPNVIPPSGKLSLSLLQLKHFHRTSSIGSTDDDEDTTHRYPSMVSSEYEDEGGTSTLSGTINNPTDDCTTLGGGASFDFSVSACIDDESLSKKEKVSTAAVTASRSNPIVYSNVGQAFSRGDMIPTQSTNINNLNNNNIPKAGSRLVPPPIDRPLRRRSSSTGKRSLSTPPPSSLEVINEHTSHDHKLLQMQESASEPSSSGGNTATDTMVVVSLAEVSASSSKKPTSSQGSGPIEEGHKQETIRVVRRLDTIQIGIILLISVALAAIICATFCIVGSCHVGKNKDTNSRVLRQNLLVSQFELRPISSTQYLRPSHNMDNLITPVVTP